MIRIIMLSVSLLAFGVLSALPAQAEYIDDEEGHDAHVEARASYEKVGDMHKGSM